MESVRHMESLTKDFEDRSAFAQSRNEKSKIQASKLWLACSSSWKEIMINYFDTVMIKCIRVL